MSSFTVRQGRRYRATISLGMLESFADNTLISSKLEEAGFTEVTVTGSGGTRVAEAVWSQGDASGSLPSQVSEIVEIA